MYVCVGLYNYRPCMERGSRCRYTYYATCLESPGFQFRKRLTYFLFSETSRPALGPTQPSTGWIVEFLLEGKASRT